MASFLRSWALGAAYETNALNTSIRTRISPIYGNSSIELDRFNTPGYPTGRAWAFQSDAMGEFQIQLAR